MALAAIAVVGVLSGGVCLLFSLLGDVEAPVDPCHKIESQNGMGWKGPLKVTLSNSPAIGWNVLNVSKDGALTTSLGNLCQCFTTLIVKCFFFTCDLTTLVGIEMRSQYGHHVEWLLETSSKGLMFIP
ncbi:hypothetical protein WISP_116852 [Willisornis vidua]|uniref:Uncharacterized protein n=1 Tax=Willisornis vidua TaxID=1566151 RepID=A0ABQ9CZL8_9PASS|nr:hypothetical protein WISP_116852 [Willisornis vidua]